MSHHCERIVCEFCKDIIGQCRCPEPKVDIPRGYCEKCQKLRKAQGKEVSLSEYENHVASMITPNGSSTEEIAKYLLRQMGMFDNSKECIKDTKIIKEALDAERTRAEELEVEIVHLKACLSEKECDNLKRAEEAEYSLAESNKSLAHEQNRIYFIESELECIKNSLIQLLAVNVRVECYKEPHDIKDSEERIKDLIKQIDNIIERNQ